MNRLVPLILFFILNACGNKSQKPPSNIQISNIDTLLKKTENGWLYKNKLLSGYMVEKERDGRVVYRLPIIEGKENGLAKGWYNTGEKLLERTFFKGKVEGKTTQWWPNGRIRYLFKFKNDQFEGAQWVFFPNGKKRELSNYSLGEKEGIQRVWNEKGFLISNYTIKNKKTYGVISVKSCIPVVH